MKGQLERNHLTRTKHDNLLRVNSLPDFKHLLLLTIERCEKCSMSNDHLNELQAILVASHQL